MEETKAPAGKETPVTKAHRPALQARAPFNPEPVDALALETVLKSNA
jgi:hypothetical protein